MAQIKRSTPSSTNSGSPVGTKVAKPVLALPTLKSQPKDNLGDYTWLIYGEKKIGKTSLAAEFPESLFMMFEPGGKGLSIYQVPINTWDDFKEYIKLIKTQEDHQFTTIVLDTIDIAYDRCMEYVGKREGFSHPNEMNDFGQSWKKVRTEFENTITDLVRTGLGVMFLSHATESEFKQATGGTYNKLVPTMPKQARAFITGFVDIIAYYGYYGQDRYLTIRGSDEVDAGHRLSNKFKVKGEEDASVNTTVHSIPMGNSATEGFGNIMNAFQNLQEDDGVPNNVTGLSEVKAKPKKGN